MPFSLDILIGLALGIGVWRGFRTGAVRQIVSFVGIVVAIVLAVELMHPVGRIVGSFLGIAEGFYPTAGLLAVFVGVQFVLFFAVRAVEAVMKTFRLTTVNRILGGVTGLGKAALLLSILFVGLSYLDVPEEENRRKSVLYSHVANVLPTAWDYVSRHLPRIRSLSDHLGEEARRVLEES